MKNAKCTMHNAKLKQKSKAVALLFCLFNCFEGFDHGDFGDLPAHKEVDEEGKHKGQNEGVEVALGLDVDLEGEGVHNYHARPQIGQDDGSVWRRGQL